MSASGPFDLSHMNGLRAVAWLATVAGQSPEAVRAGLSGCGRIPVDRAGSLAEQGRALAQQRGSAGLRDVAGDLEEVASWLLAHPAAAQWVRQLRAALAGCPVTSEERVAVAVLARGLAVQPADAAVPSLAHPALEPALTSAVKEGAQHSAQAPPPPAPHAAAASTREPAVRADPIGAPSGPANETVTLHLEEEPVELSLPMPEGMPPDVSDVERQLIVRFAQDLAREKAQEPELDLGGGESGDRA